MRYSIIRGHEIILGPEVVAGHRVVARGRANFKYTEPSCGIIERPEPSQGDVIHRQHSVSRQRLRA